MKFKRHKKNFKA